MHRRSGVDETLRYACDEKRPIISHGGASAFVTLVGDAGASSAEVG
jgi:hypothetical protein